MAIGSRRLAPDAQVDVILGVGQDAAADGLLQLLATEGVGRSPCAPARPNSLVMALVISAANGQNAIAVFPGPNLAIDGGACRFSSTSH